MHLEKPDSGIIHYAIRMAHDYYQKDTFDHSMRVMTHIVTMNIIPHEIQETCIALAVMHDLKEDTDWTGGGLSDHFCKCLELLTHDKSKDTYEEYLTKIKKYSETYPEAYFVKLADMWDHLEQADTLTVKLKEKYLNGLRYLL